MTQQTCKNCGTPIPPGADFCPNCGTPVSPADTITQVPPPASEPGVISRTTPQFSTNPAQNLATPQAIRSVDQVKYLHYFSGFINAMEKSSFIRRPLYWLYVVFAVLSLLVPVILLISIISNDMLGAGGVGVFMIWLVVAFWGWIEFQLWWNRKDKINQYYQESDDFFAIPLFSHFVQTVGEWLGLTIAILGAGASLMTWIFMSSRGGFGPDFPIPFQGFGIAGAIISPIVGFIVILITKVLSELYRALASTANNTRKMADKIR